MSLERKLPVKFIPWNAEPSSALLGDDDLILLVEERPELAPQL